MVNFTEELFNAIKTIAKKEVEALSFDTTIEATITDASKANLGIYIVTNGSIYFTAYSTNTYKEKDRVLVMVPQGDYDQQKIIIGKKAKNEEDKPINFIEPFSQIIDITNNLISNMSEISMIANGNSYKWEDNDTSLFTDDILDHSTFVWSARPYESGQEDTFKEEKGLTRVGLKADFKTLLRQFNTISGNYGLILCVGFRNSDEQPLEGEEQLSEGNTLHSTIIQPFVFDSKDFFGDIYNFNAYYTQEAVFDISQYSDLILSDLFLFAYQKNNFKNINNNLLTPDISENIFINNCYVCLGEDASNFNGDSLQLYSLSSSTYARRKKTDDNKKEIQLRWIHKDPRTNIIKALNQNELPENIEIRWYKYSIDAHSPADNMVGAQWKRFYGSKNKANNVGDHDITAISEDEATNNILVNFIPNKLKQTEQLQAIIVRKNIKGRGTAKLGNSNIIRFNNEQEVSQKSTLKDMQALTIRFEDQEQGNYLLYENDSQQILNEKHKVIRKLTALFDIDEFIVEKKAILNKPFQSIKWTIPASNSMIIPLDSSGEKTIKSIFDFYKINKNNPDSVINYSEEENGKIICYNEGNNNIIKWDSRSNYNNYELYFYIDENTPEEDACKYITINYNINQVLKSEYGRNNIYLEVNKEGQQYNTSVDMQFGIFGTSGTDYNLIVNWDNQKNVFDISTDQKISGFIELLDPNGDPVDPSSLTYELSWFQYKYPRGYSLPSSLKTPTLDKDIKNYFTIEKRPSTTININELYILEITLTNFGDYQITTRIPIPLFNSLKNKIKISTIEGPTEVRYATDGSVVFDKTPYNLKLSYINKDGQLETLNNASSLGKWSIITNSNNNNNNTIGFPQISANNPYILLPPSCYIQTNNLCGAQFKLNNSNITGEAEEVILWTQPIYIYQNNYPSSTLNSWDGKFSINNNDNNKILAQGFAAGKKNSDNTFSGVVLGDWFTSSGSIKNSTGVYGFNQGAMSYALKDDGTAFFGKSGTGRIEFDGTNAIIKSGSFNMKLRGRLEEGLQIDLERGIIHIKGGAHSPYDRNKQVLEKIISPGRFIIYAPENIYKDVIDIVNIGFSTDKVKQSEVESNQIQTNFKFILQSMDYFCEKQFGYVGGRTVRTGLRIDFHQNEIFGWGTHLEIGVSGDFGGTQTRKSMMITGRTSGTRGPLRFFNSSSDRVGFNWEYALEVDKIIYQGHELSLVRHGSTGIPSNNNYNGGYWLGYFW